MKKAYLWEDKIMGDKRNNSKKMLYVKIAADYVLAAALLLATILLMPRLIKFMWPFVAGWVIAMIANPVVRFLETKLKILRKHGTAIVIVIVLALIVSLAYLLGYVLITQGIEFAKNIPDMYAVVSAAVSETVAGLRDNMTFLPEKTKHLLDNFNSDFGALINDFASNMIKKSQFSIGDAGNAVKSVFDGLLMTIITILASYFFTAEHENITKSMGERMPSGIKKGYNTIVQCVASAFGGYFKAQLKIMCVMFVILFVGLLCLGIKYAVFVAFIIAFVDFLPVFGAGAIIWPWCVIELIFGRYTSAVVLLILYVVCQVVRQIMQPKMVGDSIGMSPLATLFFMFVGYRIGGVLGLIIGIPVGMVLMAFYREGVFDNLIRGARIAAKEFNEWRKF